MMALIAAFSELGCCEAMNEPSRLPAASTGLPFANQRYYSGQPKNRLQTLHELIKLLSDIAYKLVSKFLAQTQSLPEGGRW
jgi:hypothetical protein